MTHSDAPIMAPKHSADMAGAEKVKQKRNSLTLEVKLDILKRKEQEEGKSTISRNLDLAQPTVWTVLKNREAIKKVRENVMDLQSRASSAHSVENE
ncbi:hypothetical protein E2C01_031570 [Portunus trituberculatus]|uniref:HTH psq-type domain-containing protein n=1 Tax=Portunus trituberculatus TaxID=210409 RepID=A0A5B7EYG8_PORTR|nr:hypothetical protein [Portunus trituberculatus]